MVVPFAGHLTLSLSMNRPSPGLRPPSPRLAGRGQGEGCQSGSWSQCAANFGIGGSPLNRGKTSNIQHRTSNAEVSEVSRCHSMFGVGCSMLDVPLGSWAGPGEVEGDVGVTARR